MTSSTAVFDVTCPSCRSEFPIDPKRVPDDGIHAICSDCMRTFPVQLPPAFLDERKLADFGQEQTSQAYPPEGTAVADPPAEPLIQEPTAPLVDEPRPAPPPEPPAGPEEPLITPTPETREPEEQPGYEDLSSLTREVLSEEDPSEADGDDAAATLSRGAARFGRRDPYERAKRLARVLVSDIIAYFPEKHAKAVEEGTVRETFADEVEKSRKEYVDQVGEEIAESTDYFREALNEVLARGRQIY